MVEYRKAKNNDIIELAELRKEMIFESNNYKEEFLNNIKKKTKDYLEKEIDNKNYIQWIALENNRIISMCGLSIFLIPPNEWCVNGKTGYIGNMFTKKDYRRKGIAKKLLEKIIEEAKLRNCERILLNTTEMGEKLYKQFNFEYSPTAMALYPFGIACNKLNKENNTK